MGGVGRGHLQINRSETYVVGLLAIKKIFDISTSMHIVGASFDSSFNKIKIFTSIHFVRSD